MVAWVKRGLAVLAAAWGIVGWASAETVIASAKIVEVTARGFVLTVGTEPVMVEDSAATRFWRAGEATKRESFQVGESVRIRLNNATDPPTLRELADETSWARLEKLRKEVVEGKVERIDAKTVTLRMADGLPFTYRATDKSKVTLKGAPAVTADLAVGQTVFAKGRLLPSLDVWLVELSDVRPVTQTTATARAAKPKKQAPLPASGTLDGSFLAHYPTLKMFDALADNRTFHFTITPTTKLVSGGKAVQWAQLAKFQGLRIQYRRDRLGRLVTLKVEVLAPIR